MSTVPKLTDKKEKLQAEINYLLQRMQTFKTAKYY